MLINQLRVPDTMLWEYPCKLTASDNLFKLNWYMKEFDDLRLVGNAEFGLLVLCEPPYDIEKDIRAALRRNIPQNVVLENHLIEKAHTMSYTEIPGTLQERMELVIDPFEHVERLNHTVYKPDCLKYGKAKTPAEWIYVLFESIDDAYNIYYRSCNPIKRWWYRKCGARPWMIAYFSVLIGYSYEDILRQKGYF